MRDSAIARNNMLTSATPAKTIVKDTGNPFTTNLRNGNIFSIRYHALMNARIIKIIDFVQISNCKEKKGPRKILCIPITAGEGEFVWASLNCAIQTLIVGVDVRQLICEHFKLCIFGG